MAVFPVSSNAVQLSTATPTSSDQFSNGIRLKSDNSAVFAALTGGAQFQNGLLLDVNGAVICVDATAGLPAGTQYTNGLPISPAGALCVSTGSVDEWIGGLPFAANGAIAAAGLAATDPFYANVSLLLHFDGANGSQTITDNSPSPKTASVSATAQIGTAQSVFGGASLQLDGTSAHISYTPNAGWQFGTGDFTIEMWVRFNATGVRYAITGQSNSAGQNANTSFFIEKTATDKIHALCGSGGSSIGDITGLTSVSANTWYFIAYVRSGTNFNLYINGIADNSPQISASSVNASANNMSIGRLGELNGLYMNGFIDDYRITKGVARYTGNFTVPTSAFPNS